ncbi:amino acid adenylation domain-containing protein [Actinokineospora auranticolor]|uniref:Amino acid adenylation domain-containing protein n=1 Tax=Actinokineospora auranticolor TaxID=155976 RepID=A0A2S6GK94_9PSEU|nr:amino acid adenylation domain-containing protein [Actinokineospora auranticolor]PPK65648.1 amino acid adenylation domain-containing protein [Actinokineospora auranticolor]
MKHTLPQVDAVTAGFNRTRRDRPERTLVHLLDEQVRLRGADPAVLRGDQRVTFRELSERARRLGAHLRSLGVRRDESVGLFVEPSVDLVVGAWGVLHAGGAYLPLAPDYPQDRLRYMIEDFGGGLVLTQDALVERLSALVPPHTRVVTVEQALASTAEPLTAEEEPRPGDLAYVIYTSGSTGKPKGAMIEHRAIAAQLAWIRDEHGIDERRVLVQKTPVSFDAAQWELLGAACGATVVVGEPGVHRDPEALVDTIKAHGVTTLQCVPTLLQAMLDTERMAECATLAQVFCGGEALSRTLAQRFFAEFPGRDLVNLYGPTECTINSSSHRVDPATVADGPPTVPIGTPVHNTQYHILDGDRNPVAVGEIGELYIGGAQLARGYLGKPDLTAERFVHNPFAADFGSPRLYRTGDLAYWNPDGTAVFVGRTDNQVKLRGFRIELDEVRLALETHEWIKHAAVVVRDDPRTGFQNLVAFVELNPREAALMDQGAHGSHHQSKASRLQIRAQLSNPGVREPSELRRKSAVDLPGAEATPLQRRAVFARKSYRFYNGGSVSRQDILDLLLAPPPRAAAPRDPAEVDLAELGTLLRMFGQFHSTKRLLPKYGYASPGSLYAAQTYLEVDGLFGLASGFYYHHPVEHRLYLVRPKATTSFGKPRARLHFVGKRRAIEPVYKLNIQEVLEIEAGHMVGLWEQILPAHGLTVRAAPYDPAVKDHLEVADEDYYLGAFGIVPSHPAPVAEPVDVYVQAHPDKIADLPAGLYRLAGGDLVPEGGGVIERKHVIAINQQSYQRASFGIALVSRTAQEWRAYLELGRVLHRLQGLRSGLGLMSSGYSSKSGNDLPAHRRLVALLEARGLPVGPSYFFIGGKISDEQVRHRGMKEDAVHMRGPTEIIRDDLRSFLPDYMMPNKVVVLDRLPCTANGKIDTRVLAESDLAEADEVDRPVVAPRTDTERRIGEIWKALMKVEVVSVQHDFFEAGGNSLLAVGIVNRVNKEFGTSLPLQVVFDAPTVEALSAVVDGGRAEETSRVVRLSAAGSLEAVHCWPGLGGYTMNLRLLAARAGIGRPFYGVQAFGINEGETAYPDIGEMAARDLELIRRNQPRGPYTLWGYSFGARVAFEAAHQLELAGERVENLFLLAPGSPRVGDSLDRATGWRNRTYVTILFSVFAGAVSGPLLEECLRRTRDETTFVEFIAAHFDHLGLDLIRRIARVVHRTYRFDYTDEELARRRVAAPVTVFRARGDLPSFVDRSALDVPDLRVVDVDADHYGMLREPLIDELVRRIRLRLTQS